MSFATHTLPDSETWAIINALRAAADLYGSNAATIKELVGVQCSAEEHARLVRGFEDQAKVARSLADSFENAESITIKVVSED